MRSLRLTLAYDGTDFCGWQSQPGRRTVQGELEKAIERITNEDCHLLGSGRTDAGVHALGQVASLATNSRLSPGDFRRAVGSELPEDIVLLDVAEAPSGFHAIRDSLGKRYRYQIDNGPLPDIFMRRYCWHHRRPLNVDAMREAALLLLGRHDFRCFETTGSPRPDTIRTITDITVTRLAESAPHQIQIEVEADGFLYNMVRTIVGTLVQVGREKMPANHVARVLASRDRRQAGPTAPPQGLFLLRVNYPRAIVEFSPPAEHASRFPGGRTHVAPEVQAP